MQLDGWTLELPGVGCVPAERDLVDGGVLTSWYNGDFRLMHLYLGTMSCAKRRERGGRASIETPIQSSTYASAPKSKCQPGAVERACENQKSLQGRSKPVQFVRLYSYYYSTTQASFLCAAAAMLADERSAIHLPYFESG